MSSKWKVAGIIGIILLLIVGSLSIGVAFYYDVVGKYLVDLPSGIGLLMLGIIAFLVLVGFASFISREGPSIMKTSIFLIIPPEICHPLYRQYRKAIPAIGLATLAYLTLFSTYSPAFEQMSKNLTFPSAFLFTISSVIVPLLNISWKLADPNIHFEERKQIISRSRFLNLFAIPWISLWIMYLFVILTRIQAVEVEEAQPIAGFLGWLMLSFINLGFYFAFLDFPYWRGQTERKRVCKNNLMKQREMLLKSLKELKDPLRILTLEMKIQRIDREIDRIEAEPEHPYKGMLAIPAFLITLLIAPIIEIILNLLLS